MSDLFFPEKADFTPKDLNDYIYNKKIPEIYRVADDELTSNKDLYRFLQSGFEGGFAGKLDKIASLKTLIDPYMCPEEYLPYLYKSFGLPYFEDIGVYYNRKFLANLGTFIKRRGTMGGYKYIIRALTGFESDINYERVTTNNATARLLHFILNVPSVKDLDKLEISFYTISRFIKEHTPYYITSLDLRAKILRHEKAVYCTKNLVSTSINYHYNLVPAEKSEITHTGRVVLAVEYLPSYSLVRLQRQY